MCARMSTLYGKYGKREKTVIYSLLKQHYGRKSHGTLREITSLQKEMECRRSSLWMLCSLQGEYCSLEEKDHSRNSPAPCREAAWKHNTRADKETEMSNFQKQKRKVLAIKVSRSKEIWQTSENESPQLTGYCFEQSKLTDLL